MQQKDIVLILARDLAEHLSSAPTEEELAEVVASHLVEAYRLDPDAVDAPEIKKHARLALVGAGERAGSRQRRISFGVRQHGRQAIGRARQGRSDGRRCLPSSVSLRNNISGTAFLKYCRNSL